MGEDLGFLFWFGLLGFCCCLWFGFLICFGLFGGGGFVVVGLGFGFGFVVGFFVVCLVGFFPEPQPTEYLAYLQN